MLFELCREEFDEEKEPDRMVLSGWSTPERIAKDASNGESTSVAPPVAVEEVNESKEIELAAEMSGTKRKLNEMLEGEDTQEAPEILSVPDANNSKNPQQVEDNDNSDDDDVVLLDDNPEANKKRRLL